MISFLTKFIIVVAAVLSCSLLGKAQYKFSSKSNKAIKHYQVATQYFDNHQNEQAKQEALEAIEADPGFIEAHMLLGDIAHDMKEYAFSIEHYKKAIEIDPNFFPNNFFTLAKVELAIGDYSNAKGHFQQYLAFPKIGEQTKKAAQRGVQNCNFAIDAMAHPVPFDPINLDSAVNTIHDEYLPAITADEQMLIISRHQPRAEIIPNASKYEEDFYYSLKKDGKWTTAVPLGSPINTLQDEGAQCISADGQYLFFTACGRADGFGSCDIYVSKRKGNQWAVPENMGATVNSMKWETQPSISPDGRTLYFVSTRPGGKGKSDIWKTTLSDEGIWMAPVNLGDSINTVEDEYSPFIHADNQTLYFSSKGQIGMGGFDIFFSHIDETGHYSQPKNLGYPINTLSDETSLIVTTSGETAYFASDKLNGKGKLDIYSFNLYKEARPLTVTYVKGKVTNSKSNLPLEAKFELMDLATAKVVMQSVSDVSNGEFLVCLPTDKDYALTISKEGYLFHSENFSLKGTADVSKPYQMNIKLQPIDVGEAVVLKNIFFETASFALKDESKAELGKLIQFLSKNAAIKIEIGGHTDNVGDKPYNITLSQNRAQSVYNYLVEHGVDKARLTFKGYGDAKPITTNDTEENKALNRRTEFTIVSIN